MALKGVYESREEAPEPLREHLVEHDGKWLLDVEGYVSKETLAEFRNNNRLLNRDKEKLQKDWEASQTQLTALQTKYKDIDPDEYHSLKSAPTDTQKQIAEAEKRLQATFETRLAEERSGREAAVKLHHTEMIRAEVAKYAPKLGVADTAIEDVQERAVKTFAVVEGKPQAMQGAEPRYSEKSPSKFMDAEEWISTLQPQYPHYFKPSSGGGAAGGVGGQQRNGHFVLAASDPNFQKIFAARADDIAKGILEVDMNG